MAWLLDKLFGADDLQAKGSALDAELARLNEERYGPGGKLEDAADYAAALANAQSGATGNVSAQLENAFDEGWQEGKANVSGVVSRTFGVASDVLTSVLKGVPWWVWALVALYFAWPFIGAKLAKRA